jgi:anti-sigma B factor antagonist
MNKIKQNDPAYTDGVLTSIQQKHPNYFTINGALDFLQTPHLWQCGLILIPDEIDLTIDLSQVTYCDSSGLALLVSWWNKAHKKNKIIRFTHLSEQMIAIIQLVGLEKIFIRE